MKRKLLLTIVSLAFILVLAGCGNIINETNETNETVKDNSHLCFEKLCFALPNKYDAKGTDTYVINDKTETIKIELKHKENVTDEIENVLKDEGYIILSEAITKVTINGKEWSKADSAEGKHSYFIKEGNGVYIIEIDPVIDSDVRADETMKMLEQSLSFEK